MIEHIIADRLLADDKIKAYCGDKVFATLAPDGTAAPYMAIAVSEEEVNYDVITTFSVTIEIYDYHKDKRRVREASRRVKQLLDNMKFQDPDGVYIDVRVWFDSRNIRNDSDPKLSSIALVFSVRASEVPYIENL